MKTLSKHVLYLVILLTSCSNVESVTYQLIYPKDAREQYLTTIDSNVFYYGNLKKIRFLNSEKDSSTHFLSKVVINGSDQSGFDHLSFDELIYDEKPISIDDWGSSKFDKKNDLFSYD